MGFFSTEDKITVFANTCHLSEVNSDLYSDAVLYAVLSNQSIAGILTNVSANQMSGLVDTFHTYAESSYTLGLPEASYTKSITLSEADVTAAIIADTGAANGIILDYHYVVPLNYNLMIAPYLIAIRGWDPNTGIVSILPEEYQTSDTNKYLYEGTIEEITFNETNTQATITYRVKRYIMARKDTDGDGTYIHDLIVRDALYYFFFTDTVDIPTGLYYGRDYCVARYYVLDAEEVPSATANWWYYDISSNTYPALAPENAIDMETDLLPIVPIRYYNQSMVRPEVQETDLYKTSKTLLDKIGVDINELASTLEENPNIADIDHAYVMFGVDLQSTEIASIYYMVEFFDHIADKAYYTVIDEINTKLNNSTAASWMKGFSKTNIYQASTGTRTDPFVAAAETTWQAQDGSSSTISTTANSSLGSFEEYGLDVKIYYSYIRSELIVGSIGSVGHATKEWVLGANQDPLFGVTYYDDSILTLKLQITDTVYKRVTIKGLVHRNVIYDGKTVATRLTDVINSEDEHNFIIPIHYNLSKKLSSMLRSQLYQDSLVLVLNSVVKTSVSWYETGFFRMITMAATMVISAVTAQYWLVSLNTAIALGTAAVLTYLMQSVFFSIAIQLALNVVADWVGPEVMAMLTAAVIALSVYAKFVKMPTIAFLPSTAPAATQLLQLSISVLSSVGSAYQNLIGDLASDALAFEEYKETKYEELEYYTDLLGEIGVDSINLLNAQAYSTTLRQPATQTPEEFYNLTIHTGNIGTLALSAPMTFCDIALTLPKPDSLMSV